MLIIGHRGASGYEPENTIASFRKAIALGVDMIELDAYALNDGSVVIIHDATVNRTTNGKGAVMRKSLQEMQALDAGKGEKVPTLQEVLAMVTRRVKVNIELKGKHTAEPVTQIIKEYVAKKHWSYDDFLVSSFSRSEVKTFKSLAPEVPCGLLTIQGFLPFMDIGFAKKNDFDVISPWMRLVTKPFVNAAHKKGLRVYVYTVNTEHDALRMKELGVDGIFTNYPDLARKYIK